MKCLTIPPSTYAIDLFIAPIVMPILLSMRVSLVSVRPFATWLHFLLVVVPVEASVSFHFTAPLWLSFSFFCQLIIPCSKMRSNYRSLGKSDIKMTVIYSWSVIGFVGLYFSPVVLIALQSGQFTFLFIS